MYKAEYCPYCGSGTNLVDSSEIYHSGISYCWMYVCEKYPECDAYVGCHRNTAEPLGRLADKELRHWKKNAHACFDQLWKSRKFTRENAYKWLSMQLGTAPELTHIGMFDVEQCKQVVRVCRALQCIEEVYA